MFDELEQTEKFSHQATFSEILDICLSSNNTAIAKRLNSYIDKNNIQIDAYVHESFLKIYCKANELEAFESIVEKGVHLGYNDCAVYTKHIQIYLYKGNLGKAKDLIAEMRQKKINFDRQFYRCLIRKTADFNLDAAIEFIKDAIKEKFTPEQKIFHSLLMICIAKQDIKSAYVIHNLLKNLYTSSFNIYTNLIELSIKCNDNEKAIYFLNE